MWESRRALQKAVTEQLDLPDEVRGIFAREDEEDDFRRVPQGSCKELQQDAVRCMNTYRTVDSW